MNENTVNEVFEKEEHAYIEYVNHRPPYHASTGISFICKGKHQYREVKVKEELNEGTFIKVDWICQCGRKISD